MDYERVFIYALIDPRNDKVRYIGKSIDPDSRYYQHLHDRGVNERKVAWIDRLADLDMLPKLEILEITDEKRWRDRERWWIKSGFEFGWKLLNMTEGGEGVLYRLPESLYRTLEPELLNRLEELPNKRQADIIIKAAVKVSNAFTIDEMVEGLLSDGYLGDCRFVREGPDMVVKEISRLVGV